MDITMKVYGIGVLGCGSVWNRHRLVFEKSQRVRCVAVYDPMPERAHSAATATEAQVARSAEEVCHNRHVDIVAVLTPAFTHADLVELAAGAGKHLMLEKPMANTLAEAERIVEAVRRSGVRCFHPTLRALGSDLFQKLQELTAPTGTLGAVRCGFFYYVGPPGSWATPGSWYLDRRLCTPADEYGAHVFDTFLALTGDEPSSVWSHAGRYVQDFDQDDVTTIGVNFAGGRYIQMTLSWAAKREWSYSTNTFNLVCERGVIVHKWFSAEWYSTEGKGEHASPRMATQGDRWEHYHALIAAIEGGFAPTPNEGDGYRYVRILDAAARARASGTYVSLKGQAEEA